MKVCYMNEKYNNIYECPFVHAALLGKILTTYYLGRSSLLEYVPDICTMYTYRVFHKTCCIICRQNLWFGYFFIDIFLLRLFDLPLLCLLCFDPNQIISVCI